ncbi:MAG: InlB B-repeat-containing protein, partial [Christensenella sp.]
SVKTLGKDAFRNCTALDTVTFECARGNAPAGMPWGAPPTAKMEFLDDAISFDHDVTDISGEYARNINISASAKLLPRSASTGYIAQIDLPNGTTVSVGETRWPTNGTKKAYKAETNGTYTFKGLSSAGKETVCDVVIDDIGKPTVTAQDGEMLEYDAQRASKQDVCTLVNAAAQDSLNKAVPCTISDADLAKVQALKGGQSTPVTIVATNTGIKDVTGNADIKAEIIVNVKAVANPKYEVKFVDFDGKELQKETLDFGAAIVAPSNPTRVGYTFTGWTPAVDKTVPAKNVSYTATYTQDQVVANKYEVLFVDYDGKELQRETLDLGVAITAPKNPTRVGYTFKGWTPAVDKTVPAKNVRYTATYGINSYEVKFVDFDGKELQKDTLDFGTAIKAPEAPTRVGYTFTGWTPAVDKTVPAKNVAYTAKYNTATAPTPDTNPDTTPGGTTDNTTDDTTNVTANPKNEQQPQDNAEADTLQKRVVITAREIVNFFKNLFGFGPASEGNAQKPAFGRPDGKYCVMHWILLVLSAIAAAAMMLKRMKNKRELDMLFASVKETANENSTEE